MLSRRRIVYWNVYQPWLRHLQHASDWPNREESACEILSNNWVSGKWTPLEGPYNYAWGFLTRPFTSECFGCSFNMASSMPWSVFWTEITPFQDFYTDFNEVTNVKKAFEVHSSIIFVRGKQETYFGQNTSNFISICKILLICLCSVYVSEVIFYCIPWKITYKAHGGRSLYIPTFPFSFYIGSNEKRKSNCNIPFFILSNKNQNAKNKTHF